MSHPHPSVRALVEAEGGVDPVDAIRRRARAVVAEALAHGWEGPPFDMVDLASLRGLTVERSTGFADDQDACLLPGRVIVNARQQLTRQRYSIAHEIGHTLFPDYEQAMQLAGRLWYRPGDESQFERLCQVAAAELLMPLEAFQSAAAARGRSALTAFSIKQVFDASLEATVRRMVETAAPPTAALFLRPRDATTNEWLEPVAGDGHQPHTPLAVEMACANAACGALAFSPGAPAARGGAADRAWKRVSLAKGQLVVHSAQHENWMHVGLTGFWSGEAITVPRKSRMPRAVLCFLTRPEGA